MSQVACRNGAVAGGGQAASYQWPAMPPVQADDAAEAGQRISLEGPQGGDAIAGSAPNPRLFQDGA